MSRIDTIKEKIIEALEHRGYSESEAKVMVKMVNVDVDAYDVGFEDGKKSIPVPPQGFTAHHPYSAGLTGCYQALQEAANNFYTQQENVRQQREAYNRYAQQQDMNRSNHDYATVVSEDIAKKRGFFSRILS
jgi:uncharacterized membrane protein YcgQ (UPF0703/DUF1980 family)